MGDAAVVPARARAGAVVDPLYRVPGAVVPGASDEHELQVVATRLVLHGRPRSTGEILDLLRRARVVVDVGALEAALVTAPGVVQVEPGRWRRA